MSDNAMLLSIFGGALAFFFVLLVAVRMLANPERRRLRQRMDKMQRRLKAGHADLGPNAGLRITAAEAAGLDKLVLQYLPRQDILASRLARTGRPITIGRYALASVGLIGVVAVAALVVFGLAPPVAMAAGVVLGVGVPHVAIGMMGDARVKAFTDQFPEAIDLIVRGLRSGLPISESIATVGRDMVDPVGAEFRHVLDRMRVGRLLEESLWEVAKRLDTPEFKFFVISLSVQQETGGNLAETLENLSDILRRRRQMRLKIRAMSSEARASAMILGGLPFVLFGVLMLLSPDYLSILLHDDRGHMVLAGGLMSEITGMAVMMKMVRFEV